ncbi:ribosome-recycling factor [Marinobacter sp. JH2]|uniref:ribosome recycling factor n=1 Tax=Marinobacter sp. AL4B TaxID=2871173 RepID=UPI001056C211|nr:MULTISPECIES: ribosome recycling factor [unclassified Marinobacter]MBZ0333265.1 ribosome recycling factor [Marinobacter sp. AL4B]QBM16439.1 ribosome-recycling factor [Marinobacter sp. JH2]
MIDDIKTEAESKMQKSLEALTSAFNKIRTGRAHPAILDSVMVNYYGQDTPLKQVASVNVEDNRTLLVAPWEKNIISAIEKAIMMSDLGLNPSSNGDAIRVPMPMLTEQTRKEMAKQARADAEQGRVSVRNARRDANGMLKDLLKEKDINEDEMRRGEDNVQKLTDKYIAEIEKMLKAKEEDLMAV